MSIFGWGRVSRLEKRLEALEDFLGLVWDKDTEFPDYDLKASSYDGQVRGALAKLIAAQYEEERAKKGK